MRSLHLHHLGFLSASPASMPLFLSAASGSSADETPFCSLVSLPLPLLVLMCGSPAVF